MCHYTATIETCRGSMRQDEDLVWIEVAKLNECFKIILEINRLAVLLS